MSLLLFLVKGVSLVFNESVSLLSFGEGIQSLNLQVAMVVHG